jgi:hypothetical protein
MPRARIGLLGMSAGELWNLDPLATACAARRSFLVIMAPLSVAGGVGSLGLGYWIWPRRAGGLGIIAE